MIINDEEINEIKLELINGLSIKDICKKHYLTIGKLRGLKKKYKLPKCKYSGKTKHRKYCINKQYFASINSEEQAYFLGLLFADGWITNRGTIGLKLQDRDLHIIEQFKKCINSDHPIKFLELNKQNSNWRNCYHLTICCVDMMKDLRRFGCVEKKSTVIDLPDVKHLHPSLLRHFIRGYFDGAAERCR